MVVEVFEEIVEDFEFIEDWEECYCYVIEQGKLMDFLDDVLKVFVIKVDGCVSQVWLYFKIDGNVMYFDGDSDVMIVCGLIVVLCKFYNGFMLDEVMVVDVRVEFVCLGLNDYLFLQWFNGLKVMIEWVCLVVFQV